MCSFIQIFMSINYYLGKVCLGTCWCLIRSTYRLEKASLNSKLQKVWFKSKAVVSIQSKRHVEFPRVRVENIFDVDTFSIGLCSAKCQTVLSRCERSTTQTFRHCPIWQLLSARDFRIQCMHQFLDCSCHQFQPKLQFNWLYWALNIIAIKV